SDLVGGIQAVTLGDEEARRRGTQKTVLERKAPPTFDVLVEQEERHLIGIHMDVAVAVDGLLRGEAQQREMRERQPDGSIRRWVDRGPRAARTNGVGLPTRELPVQREDLTERQSHSRSATGVIVGQRPTTPWWEDRRERESNQIPLESAGGRWLDPELALGAALIEPEEYSQVEQPEQRSGSVFRKRRIYPMGINRSRLEQAIRELGLPVVISRDERDADAMLVLKSLYRTQPERVETAQRAGVPVYVLRGSSIERLREALAEMFRSDIEQARQPAISLSPDE
ncbi:MAG: hypothetical protein ACLQUY_28360, partial [Ktedonobacterales bacterium]